MDSKYDDSVHNSSSICHNPSDSNSEEDLIDLDEVLPLKKDSNWLLESNNNSTDFYVSFDELHFSNPLIKNVISSIYLSGKSKQVLHHLMYWNDRMTISCDNYAYLYNSNESTREHSNKRHSFSVATSNVAEDDSESLTDSLNSIESLQKIDAKNGNHGGLHIDAISNRMTQSSITDYNVKYYAPQGSEKLPLTKSVSSSQNVLSRTYDKEDLEILKQSDLSQSVFVPHISGSNIDHYLEIEVCQNISIDKSAIKTRRQNVESTIKNNSYKRLFPTANSEKTSKDSQIKIRPNSMYQVDKLSKNTVDRCIKMSQHKQFNIDHKSVLKKNEKIFETDVLTPINSPRNMKYLKNNNKQSRLKYPSTKFY